MPRYESYKDSGVKWLGEIPSHWEVGKMREFFSERKELSKDGTEKLLSVSEYTGITPSTNEEGENISRSKSLIGYKKCLSTDLVINIMLAWKRGLAISPFDGIVSPSYCVFSTKGLNPKFANYLLRTDLYIAEFKRNSTGIIESRLRMYPDDFKNIQCLKPPLEEQLKMVEYLDKVTRDIDKVIEAQQKLIDALNERKQIIISNTVTKGLDPTVQLKDSCIDWLGQIPKTWEVSKIKRHSKVILGKMLDSKGGNLSKIFPYICSKDVNFDSIDLTDLKEMFFSEKEIEQYKVSNGDLLVVEGGSAGKCCIAKNIDKTIGIQNSILIIREERSLLNTFLAYQLQSLVKKGFVESSCNKATFLHYTKEKVENTNIALPPIEEQKEIVKYIDDNISPLNAQITNCEKMISLLQERKQIIINDVVTGKKKVI